MLEKDNMLDTEHLRKKTTLYFQPVKPRVYKENLLSRNNEIKPFFMEEQALRGGFQRSQGGISDKSIGRISSLPIVYW